MFGLNLSYNKIKVKKLLIISLITGIYLNRSYAYFYDFLGQKNLAPPIHQTKVIIGHNLENPTIKYVALGDSLTEGVGALDYQNSYPYLIAQKLSGKFNVDLINLSHRGDTSKDLLLNQLPQVLLLKPDLVSLLIGINDIHNLKSLSEFESNYQQITYGLKKTGAKIYLLSIPYLGSSKIVLFPYNFLLDFRTRQFNKVIQKISIAEGLEYIDLYTLKKDANFYSSDQFHPSEKGYILWGNLINAD